MLNLIFPKASWTSYSMSMADENWFVKTTLSYNVVGKAARFNSTLSICAPLLLAVMIWGHRYVSQQGLGIINLELPLEVYEASWYLLFIDAALASGRIELIAIIC
jgi:hypothetical protein